MTEAAPQRDLNSELLYGERVTLRPYSHPFTEDELRRVYRWGRDDEVLRWSGGMPLHMSFSEFKTAFPREQRRRDQQVYVILTETGEMIGRVGIFDLEPSRSIATMGVVLGEKDYWNQGYGTDAIRTLLRHLFFEEDFDKIQLYTYTDNYRAQRSFGKVGFQAIGAKRRFPVGLRFQEELRMQITRDEFARLIETAKDTGGEA